MLQKTIAVIACTLLCVLLAAQSPAYELECGSRSNTIELEVSNADATETLEEVWVSVIDAPNWIAELRPMHCTLGDIAAGSSQSALFTFDVKDGIQASSTGSMLLRITVADGREWTRRVPLTIGDHAPRIQQAPATVCCDTIPTAVELSSFNAKGYEDHIVVEWTTESENNNAGYNIYRGRSAEGEKVLLNDELIPSLADEYEGATYTYDDREVTAGDTYHYWLEMVALSGRTRKWGPVSAVADDSAGDTPIPSSFYLAQNYPNPFNPNTVIRYDLPVDCSVRLEIFNVQGQLVAVLVNEHEEAGRKTVEWDGRDGEGVNVTSGIFFYRLQAGAYRKVRKMALLR